MNLKWLGWIVASIVVVAAITMQLSPDHGASDPPGQATVPMEGGKPQVVRVDPSHTYSYEYDSTMTIVSVTDTTTPDRDYTAYKAENDARLAAWRSNPQSAPSLSGKHVTITFREPLTIADLHSILPGGTLNTTGKYATYTGVEFSIDQFYSVGSGPDGREESMMTAGPTIHSMSYGSAFEDPNCAQEPDACGPVTYEGVILVEMELISSDYNDLAAIQANPAVYLVDTTGIAVYQDLLNTHGFSAAEISEISLPYPVHTAGNKVVWQQNWLFSLRRRLMTFRP
jgi:hypothetical protein